MNQFFIKIIPYPPLKDIVKTKPFINGVAKVMDIFPLTLKNLEL